MINGITADIILLFILLISFLAVFSAFIIALIKKAFGNKLSPSFHYYIWFVFVLRLLFPLMPESNFSVYNLATGIYQNITNPSKSNVIPNEPNTTLKDTVLESSKENTTQYEPSEYMPPKENTTIPMINTGGATDEKTETSLPYVIFIAYLAVAAVSLAMYIIRHQIYKGRIIKSFAAANDGERQLLEQVKAKLNIRAKIQLYKGEESILIGVFSPIMVISDECADSDKAAVMTHELLHYKGKDNFVNSLLILIKCIYWFNPFIHYFIRKMKDDMELLCDIKSIQKLNYRKDEYAMMLFNASNNNKNKKRAKNIPAQATSMSASGKQLIYRLKFISAFRKSSRLISAIAIALVTVLIATTLTNPIMALGNDWAESYAKFLTQEGVYDYTGVTLSDNITASEYAEVVFNAFKSMTLPYETKIKVLSMKNASGILDTVNATLANADKISPDKAVTREQAAYITDTVINHLGFYAEKKGTLSFVPTVLTAEMFENEVLAKMDEGGREIRRLQAFYTKKDLNSPDLTELAKQELLMKYSSFVNVLEQTAIYIFDPNASAREMLEIVSYYNTYTTLTDADIAKMYVEYGIVSTNVNSMYELNPVCLILPYIDTGDISAEDIYIKTTLADESLTKEEYDYMLESYLQTYVLNNYNYYKLKDNVTAAQKKEIAEIVSNRREYSALVTEIIREELGVDYPDTWMLKGNTSDVPEEYWDKYEKFDDEYDIPIVVEQSRFDYMFTLVYKNPQEVPEEEMQKNEQYREKLLGYYELVSYASEHMNVNPEEVTIYKLRDDISEEDLAEIDSFMMFENKGKDKVSIFEINSACEYKDINSISEWSRKSVEKMHLIGFMTGVPNEKFNPNSKLTWGQSAKIINNILCGVIVH